MPHFTELLEHSEYEPAFKAALREADVSELREAMRILESDPKNGRKMGRIRAALRRRSNRAPRE